VKEALFDLDDIDPEKIKRDRGSRFIDLLRTIDGMFL
jgi:hypothetical protein